MSHVTALDTLDEIDWNQVWMARQQRSREAGRGGGCPSAWQTKRAALRYWQNVRESPRTRERIEDVLSFCDAGTRLLDIGAGPGTLAVPLAAHLRHITAVEPADGMVEVLREQCIERGIDTIAIVHKSWDDVDPDLDLQPPYNLTVASYSIGMFDLRASIQKMMAVTSDVILLYWHIGDQPVDREARELWPLLHGKQHYPIPKSDILFQVLCQMGIYPHVTPLRAVREQHFDSFAALLDEYAERYEVTSESGRRLLTEYLSARCAIEADGRCVMRDLHHSLKLWWRVKEYPC
ncbi:MAG: class I SAM-dependent methyltransferase [Anaerolineae bacterium]|nr:class I SAM-dependent methyltransferase [Thermoflexales bacterium]MDW8407116.1 class I SAM-dependent methyltransferase [Anaerolineae bacterium]